MTGRWTFRVSAAGVLLLAAAAFTLSYDALHHSWPWTAGSGPPWPGYGQ